MAESRKIKGTAADYSSNAIVTEKNIVVEIVDWVDAVDAKQIIIPDTIMVHCKILTGTKKGAIHKDQITYDKTNKMSWKYAKLRDGIGMPIPKDRIDEFDLIDLVGKKVLTDLVPSKDNKYQNIQYKSYDEKSIQTMLEEQEDIDANLEAMRAESETASATDDDNEFNQPIPSTDEDDLPF